VPELPEVETIVRALAGAHTHLNVSIVGSEIADALVLWDRTLANSDPREFISRVKGRIIRSAERRGKFIVLSLSKDTLLIHLRMSGDLRVENGFAENGDEIPLHKHDRLVLVFTNQSRLAFNNPRKFGRVWLVSDPGQMLGELGPEPLDENLTPARFHTMLAGHKRQLKPLLMDQHFLAGMGNIYTDEALFRAKLHPLTRSHTLTENQSGLLLAEIRTVLEEGIRRNGASIDWVYRGGDFQNYFNVYGRAGDPCPECGAVIERLLVGQRGTHICPHCQKI